MLSTYEFAENPVEASRVKPHRHISTRFGVEEKHELTGIDEDAPMGPGWTAWLLCSGVFLHV
jgi:hypothetical protein